MVKQRICEAVDDVATFLFLDAPWILGLLVPFIVAGVMTWIQI
jgi:hypothetical protein